jgi:Tol biopolymer transport system component
MIYRVLSLLTIPLVFLGFYGVVRQMRKELPFRLTTPLIGLVMAPLSLIINIIFLNKAFSAFLGPALLITGLGFGLAWGQATNLYIKGPSVVGKRSVLHIIFWAVSYAITQILATFAPVLWVAGGLTAMFFSTGTGLGTNTNLLVRFLRKRRQRSFTENATFKTPPALPEERYIPRELPATSEIPEQVPAFQAPQTKRRNWRVVFAIIAAIMFLGAIAVPLFQWLRELQGAGAALIQPPSDPSELTGPALDLDDSSTFLTVEPGVDQPTPTPEPLIRSDAVLIWSRPIWAFLTDGPNILYTVRSDGSDGRQLLDEPINTFLAPQLSPDRSRFLFGSERDGDRDVYVIDANGENLIQLTNNTFNDPRGFWSPDSQRVAIMSQPVETWEIFIVNADGSGIVQLTENTADDKWPVWSPDGTQIAYLMTTPTGTEIRLINADGSGDRALYSSELELMVIEWSPDGSRLLYSSTQESSIDTEYFLMDTLSLESTKLTANQDRIGFPSFSPDGEWILFNLYSDDQSQIFKARLDGSDLTNLSNNDRSDSSSCWLSNGAQIAYISYEGGDNLDEYFYVMNADGSNQTQVAIEPWPEDYMYAALSCP